MEGFYVDCEKAIAILLFDYFSPFKNDEWKSEFPREYGWKYVQNL